MPQNQRSQITEWLGMGFKSLAFCVFTMFTFFVNQLNTSITSLTAQLRSMEQHQIETDKRVAAIEVSRALSMASYDKVVSDVQEMKATLIQNTMRLQTVSDFVAKHFK